MVVPPLGLVGRYSPPQRNASCTPDVRQTPPRPFRSVFISLFDFAHFHALLFVNLRGFVSPSPNHILAYKRTFSKLFQHIHVILADGSADKFRNWKEKRYLNYESLRKSFQSILLKRMLKELGLPFKKVVGECYKSAKNGFYLHAPKTQNKIKNLITYIGRYLVMLLCIHTYQIDFSYNVKKMDRLAFTCLSFFTFRPCVEGFLQFPKEH